MPSGISTTLISSMTVSHFEMAKGNAVCDDSKSSENLETTQAIVQPFSHHIMTINCKISNRGTRLNGALSLEVSIKAPLDAAN